MGGINGQIFKQNAIAKMCANAQSANSSIYDLLVKYLFDVLRKYVIKQGENTDKDTKQCQK